MKYYSEILDKKFDSEDELKVAEKEHADAEEKKAEAKALVKQEALVVEDAFKARNAVRKTYNEKLVEARKTYNEALAKARKEFEDSLTEISKEKDEAEVTYDKALKDFVAKHPEGYHITLKDGDNVVNLVGNQYSTSSLLPTLNKEFDEMLDMFSDMLRRW